MVLQVDLNGTLQNVYTHLTLLDLQVVLILLLLQPEIHALHLLVYLVEIPPKPFSNQELFVDLDLIHNPRLTQNVRFPVNPNCLPHTLNRGEPVCRTSERQTNL